MRITGLTTQANATAVDDFEDVDGATNGSRKITVQDKHGQFRNALSPRGGVAFDGSSGARVSSTLTNQNVGTDDFSVSITWRVPSAIQAASQGVFALSSNSGASNNVGSACEAYIQGTTTTLIFNLFGPDGSAVRQVTFDISPWAGKVIHMVLTRSGTVGVFYINGVSVAYTTASTTAAWSTTVTSTYLNLGYRSSATAAAFPIYSASLYNLALSASDVLEIYELGGAVPDRFKFGSQVTAVPTGYAYSNGAADGATVTSGGDYLQNTTASDSTPVTRTGGAGSHALRVTATSTGGGNLLDIYNNKAGAFTNSLPQRKVRVRFWYRASGTFAIGASFQLPSGGGQASDSPADPVATAAWQFYDYTFTLSKNAPSVLRLQWSGPPGNIGDWFEIDDLIVTQVGAIVHLPLDDGLGFELQDVSTNRLHALMTTSGVSHVAPLYGPAKIRTTTNTNGNQQLMGGVLLPANVRLLSVKARAQTGTPTVKLGQTSGGEEVVTERVLSQSWLELTDPLTGTLSNAYGTVAAGGNTQQTFTLTGARIGDSLVVSASDQNFEPDGLVVKALVSSNNTIAVRVCNPTAAGIAAGTLNRRVTALSTIRRTYSSAISLWANSTSTDVIEWDITWEPLSP